MKKIFMAAALIVSVAVIQFIAIAQAAAQEVYAASETRGTEYVVDKMYFNIFIAVVQNS